MNEYQTAFASQYLPYRFDTDKGASPLWSPAPPIPPGSSNYRRSMDTAGGPDPKKARWSLNSFSMNNRGNGGNSRNAFANYGYRPQSSLSQDQFSGTPSNGFGGALYSTLSLTINTNTGGNTGLPSQFSPNPGVTSFTQQTQTPISANTNFPYLGFGRNMLGWVPQSESLESLDDSHTTTRLSEFVRFHLFFFHFFMSKPLFPHPLILSYFSFPFLSRSPNTFKDN